MAWFKTFNVAVFFLLIDLSKSCPEICNCYGSTVDCSSRGLMSVPPNIPKTTERLDLQGNNLTKLIRGDFSGLRTLRVLQLMENKLETIERGTFNDLVSLERL
ncbi:slit homolog 2 protein-like, partial [Saccoglossus kowalevskii]